MTNEKLESLTLDALKALAYDDCFVVEATITNRKVEVFLDSDSSITFERCRKVSRLLEASLEETPDIPENYLLEVSSAGLSRPLKFYRQYPKNVGRMVELKLEDGSVQEGKLVAVSEEQLTISVNIHSGTKKKPKYEEKNIDMKHILETKIKPSF